MGKLISSPEPDGQVIGTNGGVQFLVEEGPFTYPLSCASAGWGSVAAGVGRARVLALVIDPVSGDAGVLGDAEVRVDTARPSYNARQLAGAAAALVQQGALDRVPRPFGRAPVIRVPEVGARTAVLRIGRRIWQAATQLLRPTRVQWTIGVLSNWDITRGEDPPWSEVKWLTPPIDGYLADPFLVKTADRTWLFYEQFMFDENLGTLWVAPFDPKTGTMDGSGIEVLRTAFHLSFPNVFCHDRDWYMLPEQARSGVTALYRAKNFPYQWEKHRDLLPSFPGIDPVLYRRDGRWWLFVTYGSSPCNENNLYVFSAPSLDAEFLPHPMNPVSTGLHGARMAGQLIERDGKLFRLGQDGRESYGGGLVLFEIEDLTETTYRERHVRTFLPNSEGLYPSGFHSYIECDGTVIVDGQRFISKPRRPLVELVNHIIAELFSKR